MTEIEAVAVRFGLSLADLRALLTETDALRGLLTPAELEAGLKGVVAVYVNALGSTAERVEDPAERLVIDRFLGRAMSELAGQLEGASHIRN